MAQQIDLSDNNFGTDGGGFTTAYIPITPEDEPSYCQLPDQTPIPGLLDTDLSSILGVCKFNFNEVIPPPPVFIPKPPPPLCPTGSSFTSDITFVGEGIAQTTGALSITGGPCGFELGGNITVAVPEPPCPDGITFGSTAAIQVISQTTGAESFLGFDIEGGPCAWNLTGGGIIMLEEIPCPTGIKFTSIVSFNGAEGASTEGSDLEIVCLSDTSSGQPCCDFQLQGQINISAPSSCVPSFINVPTQFTSTDSSVTITNPQLQIIQLNASGDPCEGQPGGSGECTCNYRLEGGSGNSVDLSVAITGADTSPVASSSCISPSIALTLTDGELGLTGDLPTPCFQCAEPSTDWQFNTLNIKTLTGQSIGDADCCDNSNFLEFDLCTPSLDMINDDTHQESYLDSGSVKFSNTDSGNIVAHIGINLTGISGDTYPAAWYIEDEAGDRAYATVGGDIADVELLIENSSGSEVDITVGGSGADASIDMTDSSGHNEISMKINGSSVEIDMTNSDMNEISLDVGDPSVFINDGTSTITTDASVVTGYDLVGGNDVKMQQSYDGAGGYTVLSNRVFGLPDLNTIAIDGTTLCSGQFDDGFSATGTTVNCNEDVIEWITVYVTTNGSLSTMVVQGSQPVSI